MDNHLLSALPESAQQGWLPLLEPVRLTAGQVLYGSGTRPTHVHFPTTAVLAQVFGVQGETSIEVALIGHEGMAGGALFLGDGIVPCSTVVLCAGDAWRLPARALLDEFERSPTVRRVLLRYAQALITQTAQAAVSNRHHSLEQRLCGWLLMVLDRLGGDELPVTQAVIAQSLGMRREGVTQSAHHLQALGLIRYSRGHIRILDREGLEWRACECYAVVSKAYEQLVRVELAA
jgi:CRP-like cAMP-binding protein